MDILFVILVALNAISYIVPMVCYLLLLFKYKEKFQEEIQEEGILMVSIAFVPLLNTLALGHVMKQLHDEEVGGVE